MACPSWAFHTWVVSFFMSSVFLWLKSSCLLWIYNHLLLVCYQFPIISLQFGLSSSKVFFDLKISKLARLEIYLRGIKQTFPTYTNLLSDIKLWSIFDVNLNFWILLNATQCFRIKLETPLHISVVKTP